MTARGRKRKPVSPDAACRPRRSIMIAHWDAEEYGIIGSTEWVEEFREALEANAIAYINADAAVSGANFGSNGSWHNGYLGIRSHLGGQHSCP